MCGISIVINGDYEDVLKMNEAISNRGFTSNVTRLNGNIDVGFISLPITDLNAPIAPFSKGGMKVWLNGYISNYKELREQYEIETRSDSDTEFLVEFIYRYGTNKLEELNGFFTIVIYNNEKVSVYNDRYGIKQMYKYRVGDTYYLCSEVKGIKAVVDLKYNDKAVNDWKYSLGVMTRDTVWDGVTRLNNLPFNKPLKKDIDYDEAKEKLLQLWKQSVERNKSCLPSAVSLSGGIDSGMIAKWFDVDYSFSMDYQCDKSEIENIKLNSQGLHYTIIHNEEFKNKYIPLTKKTIDDYKVGSCYTNYAIMELASKFCRVVYSGAGSDELFNGYAHRYNKDINEVIKRSDYPGERYDLTHKDYDWLFLKGILIVEDRVAGAHQIETRYPFLDNDLVDFALTLPDEYLINKRILKDISGLSTKVINSPKKGFSNPITNTEWINIMLDD